MLISAGLRIGTWNPNGNYGVPLHEKHPFRHLGFYDGPNLGDHVIGSTLEQQLIEGLLKFQVGVLFRHDLSKKQRLETILILQNYIPEMWEYDTWKKSTG